VLFFYLPALKYVKEIDCDEAAGAGHISTDDLWKIWNLILENEISARACMSPVQSA
jgi:hypothetical protein